VELIHTKLGVPYRKYWEEAPWSAFTGRESQLEISQEAYVEKSQPMQLEMK